MPISQRIADLGHRGSSLVIIGAVWLLIGVEVFVDPEYHAGRLWLHEELPTWLRAGLWLTAATAALVTAWWSPNHQGIGFLALQLPASLRLFSYLWSQVLWLVSGGDIGYANSWLNALTWVFVIILVRHEAAAVEPPRVLVGER